MKYVVFLCFLILVLSPSVFPATHTVTNSGFTFSPDTLTINFGDTVIFSLGSIHSAREVTQATWNANDSNSNGGFNTPFGGGTVIPPHTGIYYYVCANHFFMGMKGTIMVVQPTDVRGTLQTIPREFSLMQNYPNPFNPRTVIQYELPVESKIVLTVSDVQGKMVARLIDQIQPAGYRSVEWNPAGLASGIYLYRLEAVNSSDPAKTFSEVKKMLLIK